ncbi:MAG: nucleoside triphosphate pyrophosphohydrolase [Anaerolineae bacterium]
MGTITIVGLGPGAPEHLTREAWAVLSSAEVVWLRTAHHPVVPHLPETVTLQSFDACYESAETFEEVYATIADRVLALAREEDVVYAVPGHPLVGEAAVRQILERGHTEGHALRVVEGLSFIEPTLTALAIDALDGLQIVDAVEVLALHHPPLAPDIAALIGQVYSRDVASELKLTLMHQYPDAHHVALVEAAGTQAQRVTWLPLYEIDRRPPDLLTSLFVPPLPDAVSFARLQNTIARLRAPDGCPWDREQTHESLRTNLLEESYEVLSALDRGNPAALCEELGDLLLQIVLHAEIAWEAGEFTLLDVISGIDAKLKHRHPHVWGDVQVAGAKDVTVNWETLKCEEREANGEAERSLLDGVPLALPALAQAYAYTDRASRVGFDRPDMESLVAEVHTALQALQEAKTEEAAFARLGDLLLALVNWARRLGVEPESALREANLRFARRFRYLEALARERGYSLDTLTDEALASLWQATAELDLPGEGK